MEVNFYLHECTLFQDVYRTLWESTVLTWFILTSPKCPKYVHNDETFRGLSGNVTFRFCVCWGIPWYAANLVNTLALNVMPKAQGTILWFYHYSPTLHTQRCNPSWSKNLYVQVPIAYIHTLRALSVSRAPVKATELSAVGFISPVGESVGFIPVLSWLHPTRIPKYRWLHHPRFSRPNISAALAN